MEYLFLEKLSDDIDLFGTYDTRLNPDHSAIVGIKEAKPIFAFVGAKAEKVFYAKTAIFFGTPKDILKWINTVEPYVSLCWAIKENSWITEVRWEWLEGGLPAQDIIAKKLTNFMPNGYRRFLDEDGKYVDSVSFNADL